MYQHSLVNRLRLASIAVIVGVGLVALMVFSLGGAGLLHVSAAPAGKSSIGDYVWEDTNVDAQHGGTEAEFGSAGINGVVINLYHDLNKNGVIDKNEFMSTTTTGKNTATNSGQGWYDFDVTAAGNWYIVEIDDINFASGKPLEGMRLTSGSVYGEEPIGVQFPITPLVNENKDIDFGYVKVGVDLVKVANNAPDGAMEYIYENDSVTYTYVFTNTGDANLKNLSLTDDKATPSHVCTYAGPLAPGASHTCQYTVPHVSTDITNIATITGTPVDSAGSDLPGGPVTDTDTAEVDVVHPSIDISKTPDLQYHLAGELAEFTITITNTGDVTLTNLSLSDLPAPSCSSHAVPDPFIPGATTSYTCTQKADKDFTNVITVTGTPSDENNDPMPDIDDVSDTDDAVVDVVHPSIVITKSPDIQYLLSGETARFTITVHNTGDVRLYPVNVTDPQATGCNAGPQTMDPGDVFSYTCLVSNVLEDFTNVITATGTPADSHGTPLPGINPVSDDDDARVDVMAPSIAISKVPFTTESVRQNDVISFTIYITNTGATEDGGWVDVLPLTDVYSTTYLTYLYAITASDDNIDDGEINWTDLITGSVQPLAPGKSIAVTTYFIAKKDTTSLYYGAHNAHNGKTPNQAIAQGALVDPDGPDGPEGPILPIKRKEAAARVQIIYPTGLEMAGAHLFSLGRDVQIDWNTVNETHILGFNLYRGQRFGPMTIVNDQLIPADNPGMDAGAFYRFLDEGLSPGRYVYELEVVRLDGSSYRVDLGLAFALPARNKNH